MCFHTSLLQESREKVSRKLQKHAYLASGGGFRDRYAIALGFDGAEVNRRADAGGDAANFLLAKHLCWIETDPTNNFKESWIGIKRPEHRAQRDRVDSAAMLVQCTV